MSKRLTARFGRQRRSIFFAFRIVFCSRAVPEDILRDHPCDLNHADDNCSQKVQCGKNNIQQIHNGFLLWVSCMFTFVPSAGVGPCCRQAIGRAMEWPDSCPKRNSRPVNASNGADLSFLQFLRRFNRFYGKEALLVLYLTEIQAVRGPGAPICKGNIP